MAALATARRASGLSRHAGAAVSEFKPGRRRR